MNKYAVPATIVAALIVLASTTGAIAGSLITGAQIKDGTITSADIHNGTVTSADIHDGTIGTVDISAAARAALRGPGASKLVVATHEEAVGTNGIDIEQSAHCPAGHPYAVSGGADSDSAGVDGVTIAGSSPSGGSTTSPPTGWKASLTNHSPDAIIFTVYAVCSA
ncbi:MAG TPA: hypothetical protein VN088_18915 [Nocardioides sp.]|nr:hypothetical protein [Nocardioides sp.]